MPRDWEALAFTSHYHTAVAIHEAFQAGDVEDAMSGLEELIDALSRSEERALQSYLVRLMQHIIKWKLQPGFRSPSWSATIREARHQVCQLQQEHPRFTDDRIRALWSRVQQSAVNEAERDMNQVIHNVPELTWEEVFETSYEMETRQS